MQCVKIWINMVVCIMTDPYPSNLNMKMYMQQKTVQHCITLNIPSLHTEKEKLVLQCLKAYRLSELNLFVYIKSCQYSMFYTNKMF